MEEGYLKVFNTIWLDIVLCTSFFEPLEQLLGSKSQLIIGQKFEIMLDIISVFWEIWLDIVLKISFFEPLEHLLGSKSHLIIGQKNRNCAWYYRGILGLMAVFFTIYHQIHTRLIVFFLNFFLVFSPRKRIFCSKSSKKLKVQKWCQNGSTSII